MILTAKEKRIRQELIDNYKKYYRLAFSYVKEEQDALDVLQEAAYKAILNSSKLRTDYVDTWITRIVINEALTHLRKKNLTISLDEALTHTVEFNVGDMDLKKAIGTLKEEDQQIITMRFFDDMKISEIAQSLNMRESTVKSRLYRSLEKMKGMYGEK